MFKTCTILIVDDINENIKVAMGHLKQLDAKIIYATSGIQAIKRAQSTLPNLILMDIMMPIMDGIETVKKIKDNYLLKDIPIIFLTAKSEPEDLKRGFDAGGVDYITKPFDGCELISRVKTHLELDLYRKSLEKEVKKRTYDIVFLKNSIVKAMGILAEYRDNETGGHIQRTQNYVKLICENLSKLDKFKTLLTVDYINLLFQAAPLHDIGKVGIRDDILLKPGKLTAEEFEIMKEHSKLGKDIIENLIEENGPTAFLTHAKEIAAGHHEKWDGSGYPKGLKGEDIPLSARIMAIADVYDALISKRVYKKEFSHKDAMNIIYEGRGTHFDPDLADICIKLQEDFLEIAKRYKDKENN